MSEELFLANIRSYVPRNYQNSGTTVWHRLPISRRSAVFILLFTGKLGELRVILTQRSSKLKNFPGHVSFPGGKADNGLETEWETSRREMSEEIGLSTSNEELMRQYGFKIDHLNVMPCYLSRTFLAVRPCIGFMNYSNNFDDTAIINKIKMTLNPGESSSIFSVPLRDFLFPSREKPIDCIDKTHTPTKWGGISWNLRSYIFPKDTDNEMDWLQEISDLSSDDEVEVHNEHGRTGSRIENNVKIYDVWGLTGNILHDLAEIAYSKKELGEIGEEELIYALYEYGNQLRTKERTEIELKMIKKSKDVGFGDILPEKEFKRLKKIYKAANL